MVIEFKVCKQCLISKNFEEFHKSNNKDGRFNVCKLCHHARTKEWRKNNKEKIPAYCRTSLLRNRYGISDKQYDEMVKIQNNKCLICREKPKKTKAFQTWRLHVDHCHKTGRIRGLLCHLCNRGIGLFREREDLIESCLKYLKKHNRSLR